MDSDSLSTRSLMALAAVMTVVGRSLGVFPEDLTTLTLYGFGISMLFLVAHVVIATNDSNVEVESQQGQRNKEQVQKGHAFAVAILHLMRQKERIWLKVDLLQKLFNVVEMECSHVIDPSSGGNMVKSLLIIKLGNDARKPLKPGKTFKGKKIGQGMKRRLDYAFDLLFKGPVDSADIKFRKTCVQLDLEIVLILDHLTRSLFLVLKGNGRLPDYLLALSGGLVNSSACKGVKTYKVIDEVAKECLELSALNEEIEAVSDYTLVIAGYGIGGWSLRVDDGTQMLKLTSPPEVLSFAPLPCLGKESPEPDLTIVNIVSSCDMVSRLTPEKLDNIKACFKILSQAISPEKMLEEAISPHDLSDGTYKILADVVQEYPGIVTSFDNSGQCVKLFGKTFWLEEDSCTEITSRAVLQLPTYEGEQCLLGHEIKEYSRKLKSQK